MKLNLSFDINKTILIEDKAGNKTQSDCLVNILAYIAYGVVQNGDWIYNQ